MRLDYAFFQNHEKTLGTVGTPGTTNKDAGSRVPTGKSGVGTLGTKSENGAKVSPLSPLAENGWGHVSASVYAVVPGVPTVPSEKQEIQKNALFCGQDPAYWEGDFGRWALESCLFKDGCLWRVEALHDHFCDWCHAREEVPCNLPVFAVLLDSEGFEVVAGMVRGLVIRSEWESLTAPERKQKEVPGWNGKRR